MKVRQSLKNESKVIFECTRYRHSLRKDPDYASIAGEGGRGPTRSLGRPGSTIVG